MEVGNGCRERGDLTDWFADTRAIFWDWNGTLLDDADVCIQSMNAMLAKRSMKLLSRDHYREVFTFPVIDYYKTIGWDLEKESWDVIAFEFIDLYLANLTQAPLQPDAESILRYLKEKGYRQLILSAMEQQALTNSINGKGIYDHFERIAGLGNHYAYSKTEIASSLLNEAGLQPSEICLIGDTLHDLEVASHIGCHCILVAHGHQTYERLITRHACVIKNLEELKAFF